MRDERGFVDVLAGQFFRGKNGNFFFFQVVLLVEALDRGVGNFLLDELMRGLRALLVLIHQEVGGEVFLGSSQLHLVIQYFELEDVVFDAIALLLEFEENFFLESHLLRDQASLHLQLLFELLLVLLHFPAHYAVPVIFY